MLLEPQYAPGLVADEREGSASGRADLSRKNRVGDFFRSADCTRGKLDLARTTAPGYSVCSYETASGHTFARYYEPTSGRFLSADPKGHGASMSLYDYCSGDPVNPFDANGRCPGADMRARLRARLRSIGDKQETRTNS